MTKFFGNKYARRLRKEEDFSQNPSGPQNFSCTGNMKYLCLEKNRNLTGLFRAMRRWLREGRNKMAVKQAA